MNLILLPVVVALCLLQALPGWAGEAVKPGDKRLQYMGRIDFSAPDAPTFDWAAVNLKAAIRGREAWFLIEDGRGQNYYNLTVDGKPAKVLAAKSGLNRFGVGGLEKGDHTLTLSKRTQGFQGPAAFKGLEL